MQRLLNLLNPNKFKNKPSLLKYEQRFFVDTNIQKDIAHRGFAIADLINEKEIGNIVSDF